MYTFPFIPVGKILVGGIQVLLLSLARNYIKVEEIVKALLLLFPFRGYDMIIKQHMR